MILRDRCSTSYDLVALFRGRHSTLGRWSGKQKLKESSQHCFFLDSVKCKIEEVSQINFVLELSTPIFSEVSQNCFVLDLSGSTSEGSLAELLPVREVGRERSSSDRAGVEDRDKKGKGTLGKQTDRSD